ncbi:MAG: ABC transporter substrate-binding protein [Pseudomonadota bacterium]|nr:ABC transporter substrate-binding protein [Pseudomonadota bacterium]
MVSPQPGEAQSADKKNNLIQITLQLPWFHQFQFAGYYAAIEQNYYKSAGFNVTVINGSPTRRPVDEVLTGRADYGVASSELLLHRLHDMPIVALAAVFQHSAIVFLAKKDSGISTPQEMIGRRVMLIPGNGAAEYLAVFRNEGITPEQVDIIPSSFDINDLLEGKTDVFDAYITNEPYYLKQRNIPATVIKPTTYGIDFYGDILFTSAQKLKTHPDQVKRFRRASLRGWEYAMTHPTETINLIKRKYKVTKSIDHLHFEADAMRPLIMPELIEIGHMNPGRWHHMAETYVQLGMAEPGYSLDDFIYNPNPEPDLTRFYRLMWIVIILSIIAVIMMLIYFNRRLKQIVRERTNELANQEFRFKEIFNNINSGIAIYKATENGDDFIFQNLNPAGFKSSKLQKQEIFGKSVREMFPGVVEMGLFAVFQRVWRTGVAEDLPATLYKDQRIELWVENYICKLPSGEIVAVYNDISGQKKTEDELRQSKDEWERTFNSFIDVVTLQDPDLRIVKANQAACAILGLTLDEIVGHHCYELLLGLEEPCRNCPLLETRDNFEAYSREVEHEKSGKTFLVSAAPVFNERGKLIYIAHVAKDISEKKKLETQLIQAQKMESIGNLAGGVAHDFNNILTAIYGYSEMVLDDLEEGSQTWQNVREILKSGERAASLTKQLLAFSRSQKILPRAVNINNLLEELKKMLGRLIGEDIRLETSLDLQVGKIFADPGQLNQIIVNLVVNARDALRSHPEITDKVIKVSTSEVYLDKDYALLHTESSRGEHLLLEVSDNGCGMTKEVLDHIFEPFYTTKAVGKGTGMGLATVYGIVKQNNGSIYVYSEPGLGTTFKIYWPIINENEGVDKEADIKPESSIGGTEVILLAEDDENIRKIVSRKLSRKGYQVIAAADGREALEKAKSHKGSIDLLFTDVVMPVMGGKKLSEKIKELYPDIAILFASGYLDNNIHKDILNKGEFINKPFSFEEVFSRIRQLLDKRK